jgi:hypothetical protein
MNLQLAPKTHLPARPSSPPPAFAFNRPSGPAFKPNLRLSSVATSADSAFRPLSGLRLRSIFQPNRCANHRLAPLVYSPIEPLCQPLACALGRPSGCAFRPASDFRRVPTFQLRFPTGFRLAPTANLSALPANPTSDSHRLLCPPALPSGQSRTCVFDQPSGTRAIKPSTFVWERPPDPAFEPNHRLAARSSVEVTLGLVCLCTQVQNLQILWIS